VRNREPLNMLALEDVSLLVTDLVVHRLTKSSLAAEITLGGLNRCVSKQGLNLLTFSARQMA